MTRKVVFMGQITSLFFFAAWRFCVSCLLGSGLRCESPNDPDFSRARCGDHQERLDTRYFIAPPPNAPTPLTRCFDSRAGLVNYGPFYAFPAELMRSHGR